MTMNKTLCPASFDTSLVRLCEAIPLVMAGLNKLALGNTRAGGLDQLTGWIDQQVMIFMLDLYATKSEKYTCYVSQKALTLWIFSGCCEIRASIKRVQKHVLLLQALLNK